MFAVADRKSEKLSAKALFNYSPQSQREMPLKKAETVTVVNQSNKVNITTPAELQYTMSHYCVKEWWKVTNSSGVTGFVPANHLKVITASKKRPMSATRKQSFSMSADLNPQVSVTDRQAEIKRK